MLKEFREFAVKGSVIDLAVGVIVGAAFGKITTSLVNDIITPAFGILLGRINFSELAFTVGDSSIKYGSFMQVVIDFIIVSFCIFLFIRQINKFRKKPLENQKEEIKLLTEIRDALKK